MGNVGRETEVRTVKLLHTVLLSAILVILVSASALGDIKTVQGQKYYVVGNQSYTSLVVLSLSMRTTPAIFFA